MQDNNHLSSKVSSPDRYRFSRIASFPLIDLFKNAAEMVLTQRFVKDYRQDLHTMMFEYEVEYRGRKWRIIKKLKDFLELKQSLHVRYRQFLMDIPLKDEKEQGEHLHQQFLDFFEHFLNQLAAAADIKEEREFQRFICCQLFQDKNEVGVYYQGYLSKRNWGRHNESGFKKMFAFLASWERRFFTVGKEGVFFTADESSRQILDNLIFSTTFGFACGEAATGYPFGVLVNSSHRALQLDAGDVFTFGLFVHFLAKAVQESKNIRMNRFGSFARVRTGCQAKYFIDGQDYFDSLCDCLLAARKEVFITGWMISPFFSLKRPDDKQEYRLDVVLGKLARGGIKINIVIYNAPKLALNIDSEFSQKYLMGLSPNIRVLMHPNYLMIPFMWSHHEKMVIIDQTTAFMGGLDLGYGRMDSKMHFLTDPTGQFWPGVDYCNYRVTDILAPKDFRECSIDRKSVPRMPWHDIGVRLMGGAVQDLSRHFIQFWNHVNFQLSMNDRELLMYVGLNTDEIEGHKHSPDKEQERLQVSRSIKQNRQALGARQSEDKDMQFDFDFLKLQENESSRRKPQSEALTLSSSQSGSHSYSSNFDAVGSSHEEEMEFYANHLQDVSKLEQFFNKFNPKNIINHRYGTTFENVTLSDPPPRVAKQALQTHQIVRSESMWAIGLAENETENSILNAYYDLINNAKEYIYIENQFFISQENRVTKCICQKIIEAARQKRKFRVIILLPALPGFEGHPADERAAVFRVQVHLHLQNISYVYHKLRKVVNLHQYLFFFSLRTHASLAGVPLTEIIYIHSKLLIVDDRIALIGSANINDRSLLGSRDTELAVIIEDDQRIEVKAGQGTRLVGKFAHMLRKELYMEHFALTDSEATDYFNDDIWDAMIEISKNNHHIYREIFGCYPDDEMTSFQRMAEIEAEADPSKYQLLAPIIKGHAIPFQRNFLAKENLGLRPSQKEYFVPAISFT